MTIEKRNKLVMSVYYFCLQQASRYACHKYEKEDAMQDALAGAIEAAERFDETKGVPFIGYAKPWIRLYLSNGISGRMSSCKMPKTNMACMYYNAMKIVDECGIEEAARRHKLKPRGLLAYMAATRNTSELSEIAEVVRDERQRADGIAMRHDMKRAILAAMGCLNERYREIMIEYYFGGKTIEQISKEQGVTRQFINQIKTRSLKKIRERAGHLRDFLE